MKAQTPLQIPEPCLRGEEEGEEKLGTGDEVEVCCYTGLDFQYLKMGQFSQPKVN